MMTQVSGGTETSESSQTMRQTKHKTSTSVEVERMRAHALVHLCCSSVIVAGVSLLDGDMLYHLRAVFVFVVALPDVAFSMPSCCVNNI